MFIAFASGIKLYKLIHVGKLKHWITPQYLIAVLACFATYQTIGFMALTVAIVPLVFGGSGSRAVQLARCKTALKLVGLVFCVFIIYYQFWNVLTRVIPPSVGGGSYLAQQRFDIIDNIFRGLIVLFDMYGKDWPLGLVFNLWYVNDRVDLLTVASGLLVLLGLRYVHVHSQNFVRIFILSMIAMLIGFQSALFWVIDYKSLMSKYVPMTGTITCLALLAVAGYRQLMVMINTRILQAALLLLFLLTSRLAIFNLNNYIVFPSTTENRLTASKIAEFDPGRHKAIVIKLGEIKPLPGVTREFAFSNQQRGYAWYMVRHALKERSLDDLLPMRVIDQQGTVVADYFAESPLNWESENVFVIDFSVLR